MGTVAQSDRGLSSLGGRRVLVVGASSGIGRAIAVEAGSHGARVALAARRLDLLEEVATAIRSTGGDAHAWRCDVTVASQCRQLVDDAAAWLGGIDIVVYMSGSSPLVRIEDASEETWHEIMSTNLVGASLVIGRALEQLRRAVDPVVVVTTHSMGVPWPWLGVYGAVKAGLAELARAWRVEEPGVRFLCVAVGSTVSSFADNWDPAIATIAMERWAAEGMFRHDILNSEEMAGAILAAVTHGSGPDDVLIAGEETTAG